MKKVISFLFFLTLAFLFSPQAYAHLSGQPPFFKINGEYSGFYPVYSTSVSNITLPQDLSPRSYLVNDPIEFEIDVNLLRIIVPLEVIKKTKLVWDFGDGQKGEGFKNTYQYAKMGSYILTIYDNTQVVQSVLLNVLPDKSYKLPKAVIKVNGQGSLDPLIDVLVFKFGDSLSFDASSSISISPITSYFWDFGDGQSSDKDKVTHLYQKDKQLNFPLLRITNKDGFLSDAYVEIDNEIFTKNAFKKKMPVLPRNRPSQLPYVLAGAGLLTVFVLLLRKIKK